MLISISTMMKDQKIIRITMLITSIMVKGMMIQEERRVSFVEEGGKKLMVLRPTGEMTMEVSS